MLFRSQVAQWNGVARDARFKAGQRIVVMKTAAPKAAPRPAAKAAGKAISKTPAKARQQVPAKAPARKKAQPPR